MHTLIEKFLRVTPWVTVVLPAVLVIAVCFRYLPFLQSVIPIALGILFALLAYSLFT